MNRLCKFAIGLGGSDADMANNVVLITDGNLETHFKPCP